MVGDAAWPESDRGPASSGIESLCRFLREREVDAEIIATDRDTSSVLSAAATLNVPPDQIVKSILFCGRDGSAVLVIARGSARIDQRKLAAITGLRKPRLAPAEVIRRVTGFPPGGVPPIGHATPVVVVMDRAVFDKPVVYGGAGDSRTMIRIRPLDIQRLTSALVADVCVENEG